MSEDIITDIQRQETVGGYHVRVRIQCIVDRTYLILGSQQGYGRVKNKLIKISVNRSDRVFKQSFILKD